MRQESFRILFLMRKGRTKKDGFATIYARITTGSFRQEIYFNCEGRPELWNQRKERMMGTSRLSVKINEMLDEFRVQILDIRSKLLAEGFEANALQIKQRYFNPLKNTMMLIAGLGDYVQRRQAEVGVRITQRTADKYERLLRYLKQYLAQRGPEEDIPVERMNYEFLDGFSLFLQTAHRCRHNGAVAVMDCLRNFVLYCLRNEWIAKNPFRYYKLKEDQAQAKEHLTARELEILTRKQLDHRLARIRDVFVFCCLTGLAFADADHLRSEHISRDDEGRWWIHKPREKTAVMSRIPLLPMALEILRRYEHDAVCQARGRVLPLPSNQKMNAFMKEIAIVCGIDKVLTTHCARHTFACMAVEYGMPIDVLAKILGHSNTNMTRHYAKFSETVIGREMEASAKNWLRQPRREIPGCNKSKFMFRDTRNLPNPSRWSIIHYTDEKSEESEPPARRPPAQTRNGTTQTKAGRLPDRDRLRRPVPQGTGRRSRVCRIRPARPCPEHRPRPDDSRDAHPAAAAHRHGEQPQPTRPHGACGRVWTRYRHFGGVGRPN